MSRSLLLAVNCLLFRASRDTKCFDTVPARGEVRHAQYHRL